MSEATQFKIGSEVRCADGPCGELRRVVVDPVALALTHLVVEAHHRQSDGRLVPVELAESTGQEIHLRCSIAEFDDLEAAEETHFLPGAPGQWGYGQGQMLSLPYYGLGLGVSGMGMGMGVGPQPVISDHVPVGEVEVRRGQRVHATDGAIGRVKGLVINATDHHVTHVLLDEGHLWGKKQVAIPISSVKSITDGVRLDLTKDQVRDLPAVSAGHPE